MSLLESEKSFINFLMTPKCKQITWLFFISLPLKKLFLSSCADIDSLRILTLNTWGLSWFKDLPIPSGVCLKRKKFLKSWFILDGEKNYFLTYKARQLIRIFIFVKLIFSWWAIWLSQCHRRRPSNASSSNTN